MYAGHLTVTYAARGALKKQLPVLRPLYPLLLGALLPDVVDKPLAILFDYPGRCLAHSAVILALGFFILFRLMPRHRETLATVAVGAAFHLAEDWAQLNVLAWPLLGTWEYFPLQGIGENMLSFYRGEPHPYMFAVEVASWPLCLYYWLKARVPSIAAPAEAQLP